MPPPSPPPPQPPTFLYEHSLCLRRQASEECLVITQDLKLRRSLVVRLVLIWYYELLYTNSMAVIIALLHFSLFFLTCLYLTSFHFFALCITVLLWSQSGSSGLASAATFVHKSISHSTVIHFYPFFTVLVLRLFLVLVMFKIGEASHLYKQGVSFKRAKVMLQ